MAKVVRMTPLASSVTRYWPGSRRATSNSCLARREHADPLEGDDVLARLHVEDELGPAREEEFAEDVLPMPIR